MESMESQKLVGAVENGNKKAVNNLLRCQKSTPLIIESLLPLPSAADKLFQEWKLALSSDEQKSRLSLSIVQGCQTFLMVNALYEAPWMTVTKIASHCDTMPMEELFHCVSSVEIFLQERAQAYKVATGHERFLLDAAESLLEKLFGGFHHSSDDRLSLVFEFLVATLKSVIRLGDHELTKKLRKMIFEPSIGASDLCLWVQLLDCLKWMATSHELKLAQEKLLCGIKEYLVELAYTDLVKIMDSTMRIARSDSGHALAHDTLDSWYNISFSILDDLHTRTKDYVELELHLSTVISVFPALEKRLFWNAFDQHGFTAEWVKTSIAIILSGNIQVEASLSVHNLFNCTHGCTDTSTSSQVGKEVSICRVLGAFFSEPEVSKEFGTSEEHGDVAVIVEKLRDVQHVGHGRFIDSDGGSNRILTQAGELFHKTFWCSQGNSTIAGFEASQLSKRVDKILISLKRLLELTSADQGMVILLFVVCTSIMYEGVQSSRRQIHDVIREGLFERCNLGLGKNCCIAAVAMLTGAPDQVGLIQERDEVLMAPFVALLDFDFEIATLVQLFACLSPHESARPSILRCSKKLLDHAHTQLWEENDRRELNENPVRAGLFGLLEILRSPTWGVVERTSWVIFSECFIADKPRIKFTDRKWIYEQVMVALEDDDSDTKVASHFLRATVIRLVSYFSEGSSDSPLRFVPENAFIVWEDPVTEATHTSPTEDIISLLRLSLSLLGRISKENGLSSSRLALRTMGFDLVLRAISSSHGSKGLLNKPNVYEEIDSWSDKVCDATFRVPFASIICSLMVMFNYLDTDERQNSCRNTLPSSENPCVILKNCLALILEEEKKAMIDWDHNLLLKEDCPSWALLEEENLFCSREVDVDKGRIAVLSLSLCDFFLEGICGQAIQDVHPNNQPDDCHKNMVEGVGCLLRLREKFSVQIDSNAGVDPISPLHWSTATAAAAKFFSSASFALQEVLQQESPLLDAESYFLSVILFCEAISASQDDKMSVSVQTLRGIWSLYQVVASEKGAFRYIAYLESKMEGVILPKKENDCKLFSLRSIRSTEEVDESIREIRLSVLRALWKVLNSVAPLPPTSTLCRATIESNSPSSFGWDGQDCRDYIEVVLSIFRAVSVDLRMGLEGRSGGITYDMFESFLGCLRRCSALLYEWAIQEKFVIFHAVHSVFSDVISSLCYILRTHPLEEAPTFRSTLIMAAVELPSLSRYLARRDLCIGNMDLAKFEKLSNADYGLAGELFEDCIYVLRRWSSLRDPTSMPWEDIAGLLHSNRSRGGDTLERRSGIHLRSKQVWSWAFSCILVGFEVEWLEAFGPVVSSDVEIEVGENGLDPKVTALLSMRQQNLRKTLDCAAALFAGAGGPEEKSSARSVALDVLVMNLPSAPRLRFCLFLSALSKTLRISLDHIALTLTVSPRNNPDLLGQPEPSALDALCIAATWITFDETRLDFTAGIFRWLSILRRKNPPGARPRKRVDASELLPWVSKIAALVRDLHSSLKKLQRVLDKASKESAVDAMILVFFPGGREEVSRLVANKVRVLELTMPSEYTSTSLPDFPTIKDAVNSKRKRSHRRVSSLRSRKRVLTQVAKSRNRIINSFMNLDKKNPESDGDPDDAFIDLEDFLVEG